MEAEQLKTCKSCGQEKNHSFFHITKNSKDGLAVSCKACANERARLWRENNRERHRAASRAAFYKNQEIYNLRSKAFYLANQEAMKAKQRERNSANREAVSVSNKAWRAKNPGWCNAYYHSVQKINPEFRISAAMRRMLHKLLSRTSSLKEGSTSELLGYSFAGLKARIEFQFRPGMTWANYGEWHIDHKIPIVAFINRGEKRPKIINALSNLQPLWAHENMRKGARRIYQYAR